MYLRLTRGRVDPARAAEVLQVVPDIVAAMRALPGARDVRVGVDRDSGRTLALSTFDTREQAQFSRDRLEASIARLQALGWEPEAPEIYEATE